MTRITRYILFELVAIFALTLTGMTAFIVLVVLAQEAVRQGLGPMPILRMIPFVLPNALRFAVPGTILFAACSVYGRMSASNEVVALKSMGITPWSIIRPALILAFFISLIAVWLNDVAVSWGRQGIHRVVLESIEQIAYGMLRTQHSYSTKSFSITVKRVNGRKLERVTMTIHGGENTPSTVIVAEEAELRSNPQENRMSILLTNGSIDFGGKVKMTFTDTIPHDFALADASRKSNKVDSPSEYALWQIQGAQREQRVTIAELEQSLAAEAGYQLLTGDFANMNKAEWKPREADLRNARSRHFRLQTEPWRRWANGFSCFFFVLVGVPLAIHLKNSDIWTSFAVCFLPILVVYYPLLAYGVDRAKCGALPPYSVWLGNLMLLIVGTYLVRKVIRY
ncbi:MAG: lipopolysaccharide export system permease protein [Pirellulaceae bacterium]|jgi:lipopolysaccharide export system permease protein